MLRTATTRLALLRPTASKRLRQPVPSCMGYLRLTTRPTILMRRVSFMSESNISLAAFYHKPKIDGGRQKFSVYLDEDGTIFRFEVSAPDNLSFDGVWGGVDHWLKYHGEHQWSEENLEFVRKAVGRSAAMRSLQLFKEHGVEIIPVASEEQAEYLAEGCEGHNFVWDLGGGLTGLKDELKSGARDQRKYYEFEGPLDLKSDLGKGIKIRLCNSIFAAKRSPED